MNKWSQLEAKLSPERKARIDDAVAAELANMKKIDPETRGAVEAVLINSEGEPGSEIKAALYATVRFAILECDADFKLLQSLLAETYAQAFADIDQEEKK